MRLTPEDRVRLQRVLDAVDRNVAEASGWPDKPDMTRTELDALDARVRRGERMAAVYGSDWHYVAELWKEVYHVDTHSQGT